MSDQDMWPSGQQGMGPAEPPAEGGDDVAEDAGPAGRSQSQASNSLWPPQQAPLGAQPPTGGEPATRQQQGPAAGQPSYGQPSYGQPSYGQPGNSPQGYGQPGYGHPGYGQPGYGQPGHDHQGQGQQGQPHPGYGHTGAYGQAQGYGPSSQYGQPASVPPRYGYGDHHQGGNFGHGGGFGQSGGFGERPPYPQPPAYGDAYAPPAYGQPPIYGQAPAYGPGPQLGGTAAGTGAASPGRPRVLRSAAAILVVAAAALAGAGASRVIWPTSPSSSSASPSVTAPSGGSGSGGTGGSGGFTSPGGGTTTPGSTAEGAGGPSDVSTIASRVDPEVVDVNVIFNYQYTEGAGTGIVLTSNGLVLTNNHVVDEATKVTVTDVGNGKTYPATVLGYDNTHDVALLQLQGASGLATAKLASSAASIGEAVVAIGNAGGTGGTPTSAGGSVTDLNQSITANDELTERPEQLAGLIETNANIESGDSGGPLVNASGQVIGMDTAASESFTFSTEGNEGFAIPVSYAMQIVKVIEAGKGNSVVHVGPTAFLGLLLEPPDESPAFGGGASGGGSYGGTQTNSSGLEVSNVVSGAPAQEAGITSGDTITSFNGTKLSSSDELTKLLVAYHPGQKVSIAWVTATGVTHTATVTLASGPPS
ncbi:MAG TPA: trypsin-like peptidase domain-containing protein [Acidimicrobiales bacterium]|nr:trypsin-like peptidase domain-containing protein [Acidimicrobiales bacterium]